MSFNSHIESVTKKATSGLQFVKRQSVYFDTDIVKILYSSLVRSNLEFASAIWSPYQGTHKESVESVQRKFVMHINGDYNSWRAQQYVLRPYIERCSDHQLVTLLRRRMNLIALFVHSLIIGRLNAPHLRNQMELFTNAKKS